MRRNSNEQPSNETVQKQSLAEKVYQYLRARLARREFNVGDRINAGLIARELGMSRSTICKAIKRLVSEGLLVVDAARHPVVSSLPARLKSRKIKEVPRFEFSNQTERTYELLLLRILRGDYDPGEIVKELHLATEIGVNPVTVHRAAEWLHRDGLLQRLPRRGWRVTLLTPRDLKEAYEVRLLLEPPAIAGAVHHLTSQQLKELIKQTERLIRLGERATVYERREADHRFHKTICTASGNSTLAEVLVPLIRRVLLITTLGFRYDRSMRAFEEHREILISLSARDEKEAVKRMTAHLRNAMEFNAARWEH